MLGRLSTSVACACRLGQLSQQHDDCTQGYPGVGPGLQVIAVLLDGGSATAITVEIRAAIHAETSLNALAGVVTSAPQRYRRRSSQCWLAHSIAMRTRNSGSDAVRKHIVDHPGTSMGERDAATACTLEHYHDPPPEYPKRRRVGTGVSVRRAPPGICDPGW